MDHCSVCPELKGAHKSQGHLNTALERRSCSQGALLRPPLQKGQETESPGSEAGLARPLLPASQLHVFISSGSWLDPGDMWGCTGTRRLGARFF